MASLFRDRTLGHSKRDSFSSSSSITTLDAAAFPSSATSRFNPAVNSTALTPLPSPFGELALTVSDVDLRATAYEIFVSANRSSTSKPLIYIPSNDHSNSPSSSSNGHSNANLQRSLTSAAASKMKKALGMRSTSTKRSSDSSNSGAAGKVKKPVTIGELMRIQMRVSEAADSRIRRGLLRISRWTGYEDAFSNLKRENSI